MPLLAAKFRAFFFFFASMTSPPSAAGAVGRSSRSCCGEVSAIFSLLSTSCVGGPACLSFRLYMSKMQSEKIVIVHASTHPDNDDDGEEEEELVVQRVAGATRPPSALRGDGDKSGTAHDDDDDDECIPYVTHGGVAVHVSTARSFEQRKRTRSREPSLESAAPALDMETAELLLLPDDTDHPHDTAEYKRWLIRDTARSKKALLG